ncbi:threonylcarbamoyl-AMP synthase [Brevibacillus humidisoli]|uniref:L-threonylcarbamoyladenylate synthase n=1 Tax=Brevibacillus humidisoli TaxID=2895522 RepID=UPI001E414609|nr:L-threonylcarbamoyladenylate synthase [Brevibacillus humidisoli]UFJ40189.1 threonylcarbamoyl-AMP synthase [Brevibacillus humidisoli]
MKKQMKTQVWHVDKHVDEKTIYTQIVDAAHLIRQGEVVAFPTETVYGLGANALSEHAVEKIFEAKGRPSDNPLIVHISDLDQLPMVAREVPEQAERVMEVFWPGPLTLILPKQMDVAERVTAGLDTVGVRLPDHQLARALIRTAGVPVAAPSANRSGRPSPTTAQHVLVDLDGRIAGVVDGGSAGVGVESTVLDVTVDPPMILRPGGITFEQLKEVLSEVTVDPAIARDTEAPRSPGMKYAHYAPQGELWVVDGEPEPARERMLELLKSASEAGLKTGVLATRETADWWKQQPSAGLVLSCGADGDLSAVARELYACLRRFDEEQVAYIVAQAFPRSGLGAAIMNRLEKAAGGRVICV